MRGELHEAPDETAAGRKKVRVVEARRWVSVIGVAALYLLLSAAALSLTKLRARSDRPSPAMRRGWPLQGRAPNRVLDLSETCGRVNMTVFNKKTRVVFASPQEFFYDSGVNSFDDLRFDDLRRLPADLRLMNGRRLTPHEVALIEKGW